MASTEPERLLLPAEAAKRLRCSVWWLKEQARQGLIPYTRLGGGYKFTEEHIAAIIRIFERLPTNTPAPVAAAAQPAREPRTTTAPVIALKARTPRRARTAALNQAA